MSDLTRLNGEWMLCEDHEAEVERLREALRSLYDVTCRIQEAIIGITASDELDVDAVLDWLVVPSNQAKTALAGEGGQG